MYQNFATSSKVFFRLTEIRFFTSQYSKITRYLTLILFENKLSKIFLQRSFLVDEGINASVLAVNHLAEISLVLKS